MKNPRLVEALKEMEDARESASSSASGSAWSAMAAYWSAKDSAVESAYWSAETNKKEALKILKGKFNEKSTQQKTNNEAN